MADGQYRPDTDRESQQRSGSQRVNRLPVTRQSVARGPSRVNKVKEYNILKGSMNPGDCNKHGNRSGIRQRLRLYDIRHFFASKLLTQVGDLRTVSRALGHANSAITLQIYSHTSWDILKKAIDTMPGFKITSAKKRGKVAKFRTGN